VSGGRSLWMGATAVGVVAFAVGALTLPDPPVPARIAAAQFCDSMEAAEPSDFDRSASLHPSFTPFTVAPQLQNRDAVGAAMEREYPLPLRETGVDGKVDVWVYIDAFGAVINTELHQTSGRAELDTAALRVSRTMRFSPALNCGDVVPVWVSIPITFPRP
jgi:TonB family protein